MTKYSWEWYGDWGDSVTGEIMMSREMTTRVMTTIWKLIAIGKDYKKKK